MNNNYKTSIAPISSKRIELISGAPSTQVGQTHSPWTILYYNNNFYDQEISMATFLMDDSA